MATKKNTTNAPPDAATNKWTQADEQQAKAIEVVAASKGWDYANRYRELIIAQARMIGPL
ncbi:MAG TPA: hypothetical protein VEB21_07855 [Terriglobales bacterium]|nr:hypothetical protein [Terriglobales bacterium]